MLDSGFCFTSFSNSFQSNFLYCQRQRQALRRRGIRPQLPKGLWKGKKKPGRGIKISVPRFQQERCFAWYQRKYRRLVVRCLLYTSPSPRDGLLSRMPSSA